MSRSTRHEIAAALAAAFLAGPWHLRTLLARGDAALNAGGPWLRELAFAVMQRWREAPLHDQHGLTAFIAAHAAFLDAWRRRLLPFTVAQHFAFHPQMQPSRWPVPVLHTAGEVASWLKLTPDELRWFADTSGTERSRRRERTEHYLRMWVARGHRLPRLLEAPKPRLKALQRRVLHELLEKLPAHDAAHGFVERRSVKTHALLHTGKALVVRFDLRHFFTQVSCARAFGVLRALGYTHEVTAMLLGLCTTRTPPAMLKRAPMPDDADGAVLTSRFFMLRALEDWHLPQGAPTSPALANLCAWWLDARLSAYARATGATYSRYADDLVFSFTREPHLERLFTTVDSIARDEGFRIAVEKTRVMRQHQRQEITGVVVNAHPNFARRDYDALKALLHRCATKGADSQVNRVDGTAEQLLAELTGRVAWVSSLNPRRGAKLQRLLRSIAG